MTRRLLAAAAFMAVLPAALAAQDPTRPRLVTGAEFYSVAFDSGTGTKSVRELVFPIGFSLPVSQRLGVDVGAYAVNVEREDASGGTTSISGLTDVMVRAAYQLKPDFATLTFAMGLPTGQGTLTYDQLLVAGTVSSDLIPFPVTSFGAGFTATTGLAVAVPVGAWAIGLAGSYRYNGSYDPIDADTIPALTPGSEFRLRLGVDRLVGQGRLTAGLTYSTFSRDEFGADRAKAGPRIISQLGWSLPIGNSSLSFYAWDVYRGEGDSTSTLPRFKENTFAIGTIGAFRVGGNLLRPSFEVRGQSTSTNGVSESGSLIGVGLRYQVQAGSRVTIVPGVRGDMGKIAGVNFTGFSGNVSLRIGL